MYIIHNLTTHTDSQADAIETIKAANTGYTPTERDVADGFNAFVYGADGKTTTTPYAFEGHTLHGNEDTGSFEAAPIEENENLPEPPKIEE